MGFDGLDELVGLKQDAPLPEKVRELKERAVLFLEEILEQGGYYAAVQAGRICGPRAISPSAAATA